MFTTRAPQGVRIAGRVTVAGDDAGSTEAATECCDDCGAALGADQRYCLECGGRNGPLPAVVASRVVALKEHGRGKDADAANPAPPAHPAAGDAGDRETKDDR